MTDRLHFFTASLSVRPSTVAGVQWQSAATSGETCTVRDLEKTCVGATRFGALVEGHGTVHGQRTPVRVVQISSPPRRAAVSLSPAMGNARLCGVGGWGLLNSMSTRLGDTYYTTSLWYVVCRTNLSHGIRAPIIISLERGAGRLRDLPAVPEHVQWHSLESIVQELRCG